MIDFMSRLFYFCNYSLSITPWTKFLVEIEEEMTLLLNLKVLLVFLSSDYYSLG